MPLAFTDNEHVREIEFTKEQLEEYDALLNDECNQKLKEFWQKKYRQDQGKNWELFYKRNETNFFKDRTWLTREFDAVDGDDSIFDSLRNLDVPWKFIDIGCGVGNAVFPLLKLYPNCRAYEYDVSKRAIHFLEQRYKSDSVLGRIERVGVWDLINNDRPQEIWCPEEQAVKGEDGAVKGEEEAVEGEKEAVNERDSANNLEATDNIQGDVGSSRWGDDTKVESIATSVSEDYQNMDVAMLMFVLSAIPIENVMTVIRRVVRTLRIGGVLLFRDYGRYDEKEIRFARRSQSKLDDHFYVRQDGTLAVYFDKDELDQMMMVSGFEVVSSQYITRQFTNRKTGQKLNRCWLQAIYRREF